MKRISLRILLAMGLPFICVLFAAGYVGCNGETGRGVILGREFKIRYGQELAVSGQDLKVKFASLADSRCPSDVDCFWEGDAKITIGVRRAKVEESDMELHTAKVMGDQEGKYHQYVIRFVALNPYPATNVELSLSNYVATLLITKG